MENRQQQILSEIKEMMSSIRKQLEQLDAKMAEFQYEVDPQEFTMDSIDLSLEDLPIVEQTPEVVVEQVVEDVVEPEMVFEAAQAIAAEKPVVLDAMTTKQAWRIDMPGATVRDIRSAISLNDRVLFINRLFDEDPVAFQETLTHLNQMETLDEAVDYLAANRPQWNFESEIVYRFMMALRRKISK